MMKTWMGVVVSLAAACAAPQQADHGVAKEETTAVTSTACNYPQNFGNAQHTGIPCPELHGVKVIKTIVQDPDADKKNDGGARPRRGALVANGPSER